MLYIGTDEGIYRWFPSAPWPIFHSLQDRRVVQLTAAPDGVLAALDATGRIAESTTNGQTWRDVARPETAGRPTRLLVAGSPPRLVLATAGPVALFERPVGEPDDALERSPVVALATGWMPEWLTGGGTATARRKKKRRVENPELRGWRPLAIPAADLVASLNGFDLLESTGPGNPWFASLVGAGLWRSDDEGKAWSHVPGAPPDVACLRREAKTLIAGTREGLWTSADDGQTWTDRSAGLNAARRIAAVAIKPGQPQVMLAGASEPGANDWALFESKDAGATWKHVARGFPVRLEGNPIIAIQHDLADPECCAIAAESGAMWRTQTDGLWWEPLARLTSPARTLCAVV